MLKSNIDELRLQIPWGFFIFCLPDSWLVVSMHPEGPATGHLDRFSWFSSVFKQILSWFPSSKLLLHASHAALPILNSSKLPPVVNAADLFSKLSIKQSEIQKIKIPLSV
jgi:hypothetical protein